MFHSIWTKGSYCNVLSSHYWSKISWCKSLCYIVNLLVMVGLKCDIKYFFLVYWSQIFMFIFAKNIWYNVFFFLYISLKCVMKYFFSVLVKSWSNISAWIFQKYTSLYRDVVCNPCVHLWKGRDAIYKMFVYLLVTLFRYMSLKRV